MSESCDDEQPTVFVSYARQDLDVARRIVLLLQLLPVNIYWDQHLRAGEAVERALQEALDLAACVVVLWSSISAGSKWVQIEAADADDRDIIVPVRLDSAKLPLRHRHRQNLDFSTWGGDPADEKALELRRAVVSTIHWGVEEQPTRPERSEFAAGLRARPGRRGLNLMNVDLSDLDLREGHLIGASLVRSDLSRADLRGADLTGANLEGANMTGAQVANASFRRANLWRTNLTDVTGLLIADLAEANVYRTPGFDPRPVASISRDRILNFPDYSSFIHHYLVSVGLNGAQLFDAFPWLAHRDFATLLSQ